jgi:hypothetical protein
MQTEIEIDLPRLHGSRVFKINEHYEDIMKYLPLYVEREGEFKASTYPTNSYGWNGNYHQALMQACTELRKQGYICTTRINFEVYDTLIWKPKNT